LHTEDECTLALRRSPVPSDRWLRGPSIEWRYATDAELSSSPGLTTAECDRLPADAFAFPRERKEPLVDASYVRNAVARFDQVEGVSDEERNEAWARIQRAHNASAWRSGPATGGTSSPAAGN
jgi:hypothetical protein